MPVDGNRIPYFPFRIMVSTNLSRANSDYWINIWEEGSLKIESKFYDFDNNYYRNHKLHTGT